MRFPLALEYGSDRSGRVGFFSDLTRYLEAGHASVETTQLYLHLSAAARRYRNAAVAIEAPGLSGLSGLPEG